MDGVAAVQPGLIAVAGGTDKPGSLWTAVGVLFLLGALFLPLVAHDLNGRLGKLRGEGVVDTATVMSKRFVDRERTDYRGLPRPGFSDYYLTLSFDTKSHTPHAEYLRTDKLRPWSGSLRVSHEIEVPGPVWDKAAEGGRVAVTFFPDRLVFDRDSLQLTEVVEEQGSNSYQAMLWAAAVLSFAFGVLFLWRGWKAAQPV